MKNIYCSSFGDNESKDGIDKNVKEANRIGKEIVLKGHYPFIPHTMLYGWEEDKRITVEQCKDIVFQLLEYCDAFFLARLLGITFRRK